MKKCINVVVIFFALFLLSCSGSDVYQGNWKATDVTGNKFEIDFKPKSFEIKDMSGKVKKYEYTQNSVKIENSIKTYGIQLSDGRSFNINFPLANDTSIAIMFSSIGPDYTMSRTSFVEYKDLNKLSQ